MKILSITIVENDEYGDCGLLADLGKYGDVWKEGCIDRIKLGGVFRGEYKYFYPAMSGEQTGNPDSPMEDYKRCESYNSGEWCYLGINAKAEVQLSDRGVVQTICSGGIFGVESDSSEENKQEIRGECLAELRGELAIIGFSEQDIEEKMPK
jgi:hypothetical protein